MAVVGEGFHQHSHPARPIALVAHLLKLLAFPRALARSLEDGPLDVGVRYAGCLGLFDRRAQLEVAGRIAPGAGCHHDFAA